MRKLWPKPSAGGDEIHLLCHGEGTVYRESFHVGTRFCELIRVDPARPLVLRNCAPERYEKQ